MQIRNDFIVCMVFFLKLLVNDSFWRSDPCFLFWGRRLVSPAGTVSRADMVWTDAMLAVVQWHVQQTPPRRPRAATAAPQAPQTAAPLQNVGQNRALREIVVILPSGVCAPQHQCQKRAHAQSPHRMGQKAAYGFGRCGLRGCDISHVCCGKVLVLLLLCLCATLRIKALQVGSCPFLEKITRPGY